MNVTVVAQFILTMGKKNKKAKSVTAETDSGMPRHVRREVLEIVNQLLDSGYLGLSCYCLHFLLHYSCWTSSHL